MKMRPAIVSAIAIMALAGPSTAATHSLNADWRFMKAPKTIPLAQAKASVETKGTLKVTGEATFMPGAVIDVGNLALADQRSWQPCRNGKRQAGQLQIKVRGVAGRNRSPSKRRAHRDSVMRGAKSPGDAINGWHDTETPPQINRDE